MKATVLLFTKKKSIGSEEYRYPNIEKVKVIIEGHPNKVYSESINKNRFYSEAKGVFNQVDDYGRFTGIQSLYKDRFVLAIDLRSIKDNMRHATGKKNVNTWSGVLLELSKLATTVDGMSRIYVLIDDLVNFFNHNTCRESSTSSVL